MRVTFLSGSAALGAASCLSIALLSTNPPSAQADVWQEAPKALHIVAPPVLPDAVRRIRRDPFASNYASGSSDGPGSTPNLPTGGGATPVPVPAIAPGSPAMNGVVPNPGGPDVIAASGGLVPQNGNATITVVGTVVGGARGGVAMVQNGSELDYVHVGDYLGQHKVTRIVAQGIEFDDGSRLAVSTSDAAESKPLPRHAPAEMNTPSSNAPAPTQYGAPAMSGPIMRTQSQPLAPGAVPTMPGNTALPTITTAPYNAGETPAASNSNVATPNPIGTPHYNSTTPVPAPTPPSH